MGHGHGHGPSSLDIDMADFDWLDLSQVSAPEVTRWLDYYKEG